MAKQELTNLQKDDILLRCAIEVDPVIEYEIKNGTMGLTLYAYTADPKHAKEIRERMPAQVEDIYTIVICTNSG